jgi:ketosteroid isomerase-like protein
MPQDDAPLPPVLDHLVRAVNERDVEALVGCFADDYVNDTPAHPLRSFNGPEQVRRNWTSIFAEVPDLVARVPRAAVDGPLVWSEWAMSGTRHDGSSFEMRGVVIFEMANRIVKSATFYLEPVEVTTGDADAAVRRVLHGAAIPKDTP